MTDGPVITLTGWPCGAHVSIQPCDLAHIAADDTTDADWYQLLTDPDATDDLPTEKIATSWSVRYGEGDRVTSPRLRVAVTAANIAGSAPCRAECVRPCPVAELVAVVEEIDYPILGSS